MTINLSPRHVTSLNQGLSSLAPLGWGDEGPGNEVVLSKRLKAFVEKERRYRFQRTYHIVDSQIVHAMMQKHSYGFNTFAATRIGETQEGTS